MMKFNRSQSGIAVLLVVLLVALVALVGVGAYRVYQMHQSSIAPTPSPEPSVSQQPPIQGSNYQGPTNFTGVYGTVTATTCPVQRFNSPCPLTYLPNITVTAQSAQTAAKYSFTTTSTGSYHIATGPGSFLISAAPSSGGITTCRGSDKAEQVTTGHSVQFDISCDTGIR